MENKALLNFINEVCKQDDSDIDISIAELTSAINTLKKEKEKRETKKRNLLIDNFAKAYMALCEAGITLHYEFETDYVRENIDEWSGYSGFNLDDIDAFEFI